MSQRDNMSEKKIATPSVTRNLMQAHTIRAKKSLGQNFIIEPQVIDNIVTAAGCDKQDLVLEIGPGLGSLTQALSNAAGQVIALEIDQSLIPALEQSLAACANVRLLHADAMTADLPRILAEAYQASPNLRPGFMAVANLPYYITTPLLLCFLQQPDLPWRRLVFMVQKELAERMQQRLWRAFTGRAISGKGAAGFQRAAQRLFAAPQGGQRRYRAGASGCTLRAAG